MAFVNLEKAFFENTTVMLKPRVTVISSSVGGGVTGSAHIYPVRSNRLRTKYDQDFLDQLSGQDVNVFFENLNFSAIFDFSYQSGSTLLDQVELKKGLFPEDTINNKTIPICRFDSPTFFNKEHTIINNIVKVLQPHHQHRYPDSGLHYGNYHTLNFFTGSGVPNDACLIYPNIQGIYHPTNAFSLDFWINPRYDNQTAGAEYHAGTIFHMSSSIALSLVSGSQTDEFGKVSSFKLLLQLSQSADFNPRTVDLSNPNSGGYPRDLIFTSSQELNKNHWHHICVRWGGQNTNNYSGSIVIDDNSTSFYIPSSSLHTDTYSRFGNDHDTVVLGNFLDSPSNFGQKFFVTNTANNQGLYDRGGGSEPTSTEQSNALKNGLNAEISDVKFFKKYLNNQELEFLRFNGISNVPVLNSDGENVSGDTNLFDDLIFYVPVFFFPQNAAQSRKNTLISPVDFTDLDFPLSPPRISSYSPSTGRHTFYPFNHLLAHNYNVREINLENFVIEFKEFLRSQGTSINAAPRLQSLTSSAPQVTSAIGVNSDATRLIFENELTKKQFNKRNLTILPNDNGLFYPNYYPISKAFEDAENSGGSSTLFKDYISNNLQGETRETVFNDFKLRFNNGNFDKISLENTFSGLNTSPTRKLFPPDSTLFLISSIISNGIQEGTTFNQIIGPHIDLPGSDDFPVSSFSRAAIPHRLGVFYSNQMTCFDISNLYYGNRICPGSFEIFDNSVTGSDGVVKIRLKDNEHGSLYRADCLTKQATWNNVGDIYYDEGLVLIKSPHMSYYCKDRTEISLTGEQNLHTLVMNIPVETGLVNSSSNATFKSMPPSENINDADKEAVYITGVNIHDNNFNIIMKAQFAQPIIKADDDEFIIRLKQDF